MFKTIKSVHKPTIALTLLVGVLLHSPTYAEEATVPAMNPEATAPKATYQSAFDGYQAWDDAPMKGWREAHEDVMGGGHAGHDKPAGNGDASPGSGKPDPRAGQAMKHGGQH
jgi:hypothetical protein